MWLFWRNKKKLDVELKDEEINYYENEIKKNENIINEIELIFNNYKKLFKDLENNFNTFKDNVNKKIKFMYEIINFYKKKKIESNINYQMKYNIENNNFDLSLIKQNIKNKLNIQTKEIKEIITILKMNENKNIINKKQENEIKYFKNFNIENIQNITIIIMKEILIILKH